LKRVSEEAVGVFPGAEVCTPAHLRLSRSTPAILNVIPAFNRTALSLAIPVHTAITLKPTRADSLNVMPAFTLPALYLAILLLPAITVKITCRFLLALRRYSPVSPKFKTAGPSAPLSLYWNAPSRSLLNYHIPSSLTVSSPSKRSSKPVPGNSCKNRARHTRANNWPPVLRLRNSERLTMDTQTNTAPAPASPKRPSFRPCHTLPQTFTPGIPSAPVLSVSPLPTSVMASSGPLALQRGPPPSQWRLPPTASSPSAT